jgi:flagellar FliL protein
MPKILLPVVLALGGLGAGIAAGLALRPAPEPDAAACEDADGEACDAPAEVELARGESAFVPLDKPFVIPVFDRDRVAAMVVLSLALDVPSEQADAVARLQPRLRDSLLAVMFRHANSGGFDGSFTAGQKMADLKAGLLTAARTVLEGIPVREVLVTEIVRQDV